MAAKKVGTLIREARTAAGLTQEQLAKKISGLSASDISKAERGEKELTQAQLKSIAKITGVTQSSLLNAPKGGSSSTSSAKKPASSGSSTGSSSNSVKVTAEEKKLLQYFRKADAETRESAMKVLKESAEGKQNSAGSEILNTLLDGALNLLSGKS